MVETNDADNLTPELDNRLDDLFDENDTLPANTADGDVTEYYPLSELKNLILSIDWEITDEVLEKLLQQINDLNMTYEHDKIVLTFLQILNSLGVYIKKNRAKAHPKTFKTLNSVFSSLDKVVLSKDMAETEKKKILNTEMEQYKKLRFQIAQSKAQKKKNKTKRQESVIITPESFFQASRSGNKEAPDPQPSQELFADALAQAVEEIKNYMHAEIEALKAEIKSCTDK